MKPYGQHNNLRKDPARVILVVLSLIIISLSIGMNSSSDVTVDGTGITRETPTGFLSISDIAAEYSSQVIENGTSYDIQGSLSLPASKPLYLGPGIRLQFSPGSFLNLTAPPLFMGSELSPVELVPLVKESEWGGVNILEGDPSVVSTMENVTIRNATIGLRTSGSDLRLVSGIIENCSRSGIESLGPIPGGNGVFIGSTIIKNCTYYGIHLQKVPISRMIDLTISSCGTGIRSFQSDIDIYDSDIIDPASLGLVLVNSAGNVEDCFIGSSEGSTSAPQNLLTSLNSTGTISRTSITGANVCLYILSGSEISIIDSVISNGFTDCIWGSESDLSIHKTLITEAGESAIHTSDCDLELVDTDLTGNGGGSGSFVFSSLYLEDTYASIEGGSITSSGDAHFDLHSSRVVIANATLGSFGNYPCILDTGSVIEYINTQAPSSARFVDLFSKIISSITPVIEVIDYQTKDPVSNSQVDITNRLDELVDSLTTGTDGSTGPAYLTLYSNTSTGTISYLPATIAAMKGDSEISVYSLVDPQFHITMELFPPNDPPSLNLINPVNGTVINGSLRLEGYIQDDLDINKLRYRIDQGHYETLDLVDVSGNGYFSVDIEPGTVSKGIHDLWVHAFDGSHLSAPSIRELIMETSSLDDSDNDGIPDIIEDANGNGILDDNETDPNVADTDNDGLLDGIEIDDSDGATTDPRDADSDDDFLIDGLEDANQNGRVDINETDPNLSDTDGDNYTDLEDKFPLDSTKWKEIDQGDQGSTTTLILIILIGILLIVFVYALYQRLGGNPRTKEEPSEEDFRGSRRMDHHRRGPQRGNPHERKRQRDRS